MGGPLPPAGVRAVRTREERFKQAAWAYLVYGLLYWFGGFYLQLQGLGRGRGVLFWFVLGGLLVVVIPYLLARERAWFDRWVLSRRDFARFLTVLMLFRAFEVGRIALRGPAATAMPAIGGGVLPTRLGAWLFFAITLAAAALVARAAWSRGT